MYDKVHIRIITDICNSYEVSRDLLTTNVVIFLSILLFNMGQKIVQVAFVLIVTVLAFSEPDFQGHRRLERYQQQPLFGGGLRNFLFGPFPIRQTAYHSSHFNNNYNKPSYFLRKPKQQVIKQYRVLSFSTLQNHIACNITMNKRFLDVWRVEM